MAVILSVALLAPACAGDDFLSHDRDDSFRGGETLDPNTPPQETSDDPEEPVAAPVPETLAVGLINPRNLVVRDQSLYWVDAFQADVRLNWSHVGGGATVSVATLASLPFSMVADDAGVYLVASSNNKILFASHLGFAVQALFASSSGPRSIALTEHDIYWTAADGCLYRAAKEGGEVESVACGAGLPNSLAIASGQAYWTSDEGTLFKSSLESGSVAVKLASNQDFGFGIVADQSGVYWIDANHRELRRYHHSSSQINVLANSQYALAGLTQDRFYLYFTTQGDGAIKRIRKIGGVVAVMADLQDKPGEIVVDDNWAYWLNQGDGTVMRLAKPN